MGYDRVRYYKVIKRTTYSGTVIFKVFATRYWICKFFNCHEYEYKDSDTLEEAIERIKNIHRGTTESEIKVHFTSRKKLIK